MTASAVIRSESRLGASTLAVAFACLVLPGISATAADPKVTDGDVTRAIDSDYWVDEVVDANRVDVSTKDGVVSLTGTVDSLLARERAQAIAESIVGVRAVVNRIEVGGPLRSDAELAKAVDDALLRDPATDSYEVDVAASTGVITLRGTVDSWAEKRLSGSVAKGVRGVREVRNDLIVRARAARPDAEIDAEVERRLANDVRVDDYAIDVEVEDSVVRLSGTVGSLAEKSRARDDAWVAGVRSVDSDALEVEWWARDEMRRKSLIEDRSDDEIRKAARDALLYDPRVLPFNPAVYVSRGIVTLSGVVEDAAAKRAAEADARNVVGVRGVRNHLKVRPATVPADEELEKRVGRALAEDPYVERWEIDVDAASGWVFLSGNVDNSFEKQRAHTIAARVKGVVDVIDNVEYEREWVWKPDWEIREQVDDQLFWSPFVDADQVTVAVDNGVVTLTGEVDTWAERSDAEENAWEGGAKDVRNELTVAHQVYGPLALYGPLGGLGWHLWP